MKSGVPKFRLFLGAILVALIMATFSPCHADPALSAQQIIQKAVARATEAEAKSTTAGFTYTKCTVTEELDSSGNVRDRKEKVYKVVFRDGSTYLKLVSVNGRTPGSTDFKKQSDNDSSMRQIIGDSKKQTSQRGDSFLTPELAAHFDFRLVGHSTVSGRDAYEVAFEPKNPEVPVRHIIDRLLNRISGTMWIDASEFEVAKADVHLRSEVSLLGGVVGSLKKLVYSVTRERIADGFWLSTSSTGDFQGRKLVEQMRIKTKTQNLGFQPLG